MTSPTDPASPDRDPGDEAPDSFLRNAAFWLMTDLLPFIGALGVSATVAALLPAWGAP